MSNDACPKCPGEGGRHYMSCSLGGAKGLTLPAREVAMPPSTLRRPLERLVAHYREHPEEWSGYGPGFQLLRQGALGADVRELTARLGLNPDEVPTVHGRQLRIWRDRTPYSEGLAALERVLADLPEVAP